MEAVSPVCPGSGPIEIVLAKDQTCYKPLPVVYLDSPVRPMLSRWRLSDEEREAVMLGADIILTQLTFGLPFHPISLQIVGQDEMPYLGEE